MQQGRVGQVGRVHPPPRRRGGRPMLPLGSCWGCHLSTSSFPFPDQHHRKQSGRSNNLPVVFSPPVFAALDAVRLCQRRAVTNLSRHRAGARRWASSLAPLLSGPPPAAPAGHWLDATLPTAAAGGQRRGLRLHLPTTAAAAARRLRPTAAAPPGTLPGRCPARPAWCPCSTRVRAGRSAAALHGCGSHAALPAHDDCAAAPAGGLHAAARLPTAAGTLPAAAHGNPAGCIRAALWHSHAQGSSGIWSNHATAPHAAHAQRRPAACHTAAAADIPAAAGHAIHGGTTTGHCPARLAVPRLARWSASGCCCWQRTSQQGAVGSTCGSWPSCVPWWPAGPMDPLRQVGLQRAGSASSTSGSLRSSLELGSLGGAGGGAPLQLGVPSIAGSRVGSAARKGSAAAAPSPELDEFDNIKVGQKGAFCCLRTTLGSRHA